MFSFLIFSWIRRLVELQFWNGTLENRNSISRSLILQKPKTDLKNLTLYFMMLKNGQTCFKNLAV